MSYHLRIFVLVLLLLLAPAALADADTPAQPPAASPAASVSSVILPDTASSAAVPAASPSVPLKVGTGEWRTFYETVKMPVGDSMGASSLAYLVDVTPNYSVGPGIYGGVAGNYGGFFTIGIENEFKYKLTDKLSYNLGLFTGGGGGAGIAGQGGGLMLRPHTGLIYDMGNWHIGAEYSWVKFPNGKIDSSQIAILVGFPLEIIYADGKYLGQKVNAAAIQGLDTPGHTTGMTRQYVTVIGEAYTPYPNIYKAKAFRQIQSVFDVVGAEVGNYTSDNDFVFIELAGCAGGAPGGNNSDGYMEIVFGKGYIFPVFGSQNLYILGKGAVGAGGGGFVPTGGGLIAKLYGGLEYRFTPDLAMRVYGGYMGAPTDALAATTIGVNMGYMIDTATFDTYAKKFDSADKEYILKGWRIRAGTQGYFNGNIISKPRSVVTKNPIELMSIKLDDMLTDNWYLTGNAIFAYAGGDGNGVGGFALGMFGAGYQTPLFADHFRLFGEATVGAAGGGALAVAGGTMTQGLLGISYKLNENTDIQVDAGIVKATATAFQANILEVMLTYQFNTINGIK